MDKKSALLTLGAISFLVAPFMLSACTGTTVPTSTDQTETQSVATQETAAATTETSETTETTIIDQNVDVDALYSDLQKNLPSYFQGSDVSFTGIKALDTDKMMAPYKDAVVAEYKKIYETGDWSSVEGYFFWYEVGDIVKGTYAGQKLLVLNGLCDGMCIYSNLYRFAYDPKTEKLTALMKMSSEHMDVAFASPLLKDADTKTVLNGLLLPDELKATDGKGIIKKTTSDAGFQLEGLMKNVLYTDSSVGPVYSPLDNGLGCLYVARPDGTLAKYEYDPGFFAEKTTIKWDDGSAATTIADHYGYAHFGCGIEGNCYTVELLDLKSLEKAGTTSTGIDLYQVKTPVQGASESTDSSLTPQQKKVDELFQMQVNTAAYSEDKVLMTWDQYLVSHPVLYWKDPFGRYSSLINSKVQPMAECGKPVVYLYPEKTQDVSVKVLIDEFTKTIPDYGNGWFVKATPESEIYNYADGQTYPYLFWEGHKKGGMSVDRGFMVARDELATFLPESLKKMGLNEKETADFMDFWYTRMLDNAEPYFFVSFMGTADFNKVAPLEISPAPDTLIRVFMYYHPVDAPFTVQEQDLKSIPRNGFTVVEWGGTSSRPWAPEL